MAEQFLETLTAAFNPETYNPETKISDENFFGTLTPAVLEQIKAAPEDPQSKEGGSGTVSVMTLALNAEGPSRFYVKKIQKTNVINERNRAEILKKNYNEIKSITNEININRTLTQHIPTYVSKCPAAYISYSIDSAQIAYTAYIVFEFLPGFSLADYLFKYRKTNPVPNADEIKASVVQCLEALHASGYVHRDVKPENIFLVSSNKLSDESIIIKRCILIDFGESLPIGATLNIEYNAIKGNDRYNPWLQGKNGFNWVAGTTKAEPRENNAARNSMFNMQSAQYGFVRSGGSRRTKRRHISSKNPPCVVRKSQH
jgi:serine/threonine protein kinase